MANTGRRKARLMGDSCGSFHGFLRLVGELCVFAESLWHCSSFGQSEGGPEVHEILHLYVSVDLEGEKLRIFVKITRN